MRGDALTLALPCRDGDALPSLRGSRMDEQRCSFPPPLKVGLDAGPPHPSGGCRLPEQCTPKGLGD